ncbi:uncharacterized protein [Gossypium hirsutum]|uniref:Reverse transcriptase domain-containing protein n=1 Tax=Gossypium hirsutum TaxID=3635 RepID=A0A1U8KGC0_GOSHI|nr:uncharacterized protein LOC107915357 [Gossypium hirsutum]
MNNIREKLGPWQYQKYRRMKYKINELEKKIDKIFDGTSSDGLLNLLNPARGQLGQLYDEEERYWAQRARNQWLRKGDRNTRYFHVRATGRKKKNRIDKLKDKQGLWHSYKNEICQVVWNYFNDLFKTSCRGRSEFKDEEIMVAFKQMDPQKAPGIDGLPGSFFKEHWTIVGNNVLKLCQDILHGHKSVDCINDTLMVMILKINNPCEMTNFRAISLCRFIYKIISKFLANRLKVVLPFCITQNQSTFIPGRMIHNNVLVAHELMNYLRSPKNSPNKGCVIKLDMSKAYDRVEWSFIKKVMLKMGFSRDWIKKIMNCVSTVRYRAKCNMNLTDIIVPENGFCQGDPLSPYFFFVWMFFPEVEAFMEILDRFMRMSGQSINLEKSMVYFSPKTPVPHRATLRDLLKMKVVDKIDGYLVLPILVTKRRSRCAQRDSIDDELGLVGLWGEKKGWNMLSWNRLCYPKGMGGLGLREVGLFNIDLFGRQVWRLINCRDTLCYKVLSAKYFLGGDVFHPKNVEKPSFTWFSIAKAANALYEGFGWTVGNGRSIKIWHDNWGFEGISGKSICVDKRLVKEENMCELFNDRKDGWDTKRILEIYGENMKDHICNIPIIHDGPDDQRIWFHNPHGVFSSKSAYSCIRNCVNDICKRCGKGRETLILAMKDCPKARAVLEFSGLNNKFLGGGCSRCIDWIEDIARELDNKAISDFITVLWNIWNSRNNCIFRRVEDDARVTWKRAVALSRDFQIFNLVEDPLLPRKTVTKTWQKPHQGVLKINFDASVQGEKVFYGLVVRDTDGFVHGGRMGFMDKVLPIE